MTILYEQDELSSKLIFNVCSMMLEWGQKEGAIPADRARFVGTEHAVLAMDDAVLADGPACVGVAVFYQPADSDLLWLDVLYVSPDWRRRGIGGDLLDIVHAVARRWKLKKVMFGTATDNVAMQGLGRRHGFGDYCLQMVRPASKKPAQ